MKLRKMHGLSNIRNCRESLKTLAKHLNDKIKDIDKRWPKMTDSERSNTVIQMVSMRRKLTDAIKFSASTKGMYQKRAGD